MKGERRHELEKNELADWLAKVFGVVGPYQNAILGAVLLLLVGAVGYLWWAGQAAGKQAAASDEFQRALWDLSQGSSSTADFEAIVEDYPDTGLALWARVMAGDLHLAFGCDSLFTNKGVANQELREAVDHYREVLGAESSSSALRQRATFGLARALESQGDLQKAMQRYEEVGKSWPEGAYAAAAASRLEDLEKPATRLFYDRFAKFDPKPVSSLDPGGLGEPPAFDLESLRDDEPLFKSMMPSLEERGVEDDQPQDSPETPAKPADTQPDATEAKSTDTKSTDTEPTDTGTPDPGATSPAEPDPAEPPAKKSE